MTKEEFLTVRWNNVLTLGLGFFLLVYVVFVLATPVISDFAAFIGLVVLSVFY